MPRTKKQPEAPRLPRNGQAAPLAQAEATPRPAVFVIEPNGVYRAGQLIPLLGLRASTLRREIREGRLGVCRRAGMNFFLGCDLLDWLKAGRLVRGRESSAE